MVETIEGINLSSFLEIMKEHKDLLNYDVLFILRHIEACFGDKKIEKVVIDGKKMFVLDYYDYIEDFPLSKLSESEFLYSVSMLEYKRIIKYDKTRKLVAKGDKFSMLKKEIDSSATSWKNNFDLYLKLTKEARDFLLNDKEFRETCEIYYPRYDYEKTINKAVDCFWGTEEGWNYKKKTRAKGINMVATLKKNFMINRVIKEDAPPVKYVRHTKGEIEFR